MADRIERYLGRLEAELEGRVPADRLEKVLLEVEGHLRESEEAYRELGEPEELANRLAVEGFGGVEDLQVQIENKGRFEAFWVKLLQASATVFTAIGLIGIVLVSSIVSSMTTAFWIGIVPMIGLLFAAMFLGRSVWKRALWGGVSGTVLLMVLFLSIGRVAFDSGWPVLGLQVGNNDVISRGQAYSAWMMMLEFRQSEEMLRESRAYLAMADEGVNLFPFARVVDDGTVLSIRVEEGSYEWKRTKDFEEARKSWQEDGPEFLALIEENHVRAKARLAMAHMFTRNDFAGRLLPLLYGLAQLVGASSLMVAASVAIGLGMRQLTKGLERLRSRLSAVLAGH